MIASPLVTVAILALSPHLQADTTAGIRGTAVSSFNGQPLSGVMISVPAAHKSVVTTATGAFVLGGLRDGTQKIRVSYDGKDTDDYAFTLFTAPTKQLPVRRDQ